MKLIKISVKNYKIFENLFEFELIKNKVVNVGSNLDKSTIYRKSNEEADIEIKNDIIDNFLSMFNIDSNNEVTNKNIVRVYEEEDWIGYT